MPLQTLDESRLRLLFELSRSFTEHIDLEALLTTVVARCREVFGPQANVAVMLVDEDAGCLYFPYADTNGRVHMEQLRDVRIPLGAGISGAVLQGGEAQLIADAQLDPRFDRSIERLLGVRVGSILAAPLKTRDGAVGLMTISQPPDDGPYTTGDLAFLESLASCVALAIENAQMYARLRASEEDLRVEIGALRRDLERRDLFPEIIGTSPAIRELIRLMESAAASPIAVLVEGETGTGKELVACGIHRASPRGSGPFLAINCGAFTETLLESELFGHERGSFTGAERAKRGLFETLAGGTILLDEVGEMPPAMQVKLLRVLQESEVIPVGSTTGRRIDVRVISASNASLERAVAEGRFRADLFYRLAGFPIRVPPLVERRVDIPALTDHLLRAAMASHDKPVIGISRVAREVLSRYDWPGNVRELRNEIERAVALAQPGDMIGPDAFSATVLAGANGLPGLRPRVARAAAPRAGGRDAEVSAGAASLRTARHEFEARYIAEVMESAGGNVSRAAGVLGISRVMLHKKLKALGLRRG